MDLLSCVSVPGYSYECLYCENKGEVEHIRDKETNLSTEKFFERGLSAVRWSKDFEFDVERWLRHDVGHNLNRLSMTQA